MAYSSPRKRKKISLDPQAGDIAERLAEITRQYKSAERKLKEETQKNSILLALSRAISLKQDTGPLLELIAEKAIELTGAIGVSIRTVDAFDGKNLPIRARRGLEKYNPALIERLEMPLGRELLIKKIPKAIDNLFGYIKTISRCASGARPAGVTAFPLFKGNTKLGVLYVYHSAMKTKEPSFTDLVGVIGSFCTTALSSAEMLERIKADYLNTIKTLARVIEANDKYTIGHSEKVMKYALRLCDKLGIAGRDLVIIKNASLLHDMGKISIDQIILRKRQKLTSREWKGIKQHPRVGSDIIRQIGFLGELVPIIANHHQRFDGSGYPNPTLKNGRIPLGSRIIAIADAFDAMTSERPYRRRAFTKKEALREIERCAGTQFDPALVDIFEKTL